MSEKSCIFLLADGARADLFEYLLNRGELPNISKYIVERGSFNKAVSVFPSTTGPAYTPYILGKYPGRCNLPGIRWFDRYQFGKNRFSLKGFRSYIGPETYLMNRDLHTNGTPTLFELVPRSVSILNEITKGLSYKGDKTRFLKVFYKIKSHFTSNSNEVDEAAGRMLLQCLEENPQLVFCVFLGIDTYSHQFHPFHRNVVDSYRFLDRYVGLIGKYLKQKDKLEDTLIVVGSDHGLTPTHSHFDSPLFMDNLGYRTLHHTNVFSHILDADASVMISGNSMAHIYVKSKEGWKRNSYIEEIPDLTERLLERPEIDIIAGRTTDGKIAVRSTKGEATLWIKGEKINYKLLNGSDPFGYGKIPQRMSLDRVLDLTIETNYPDAILQIAQLFDSVRTGDLVLSAKPGIDLRARDENPEHSASHGSLVREHMMVPLAINTRSCKKNIRTTDIYPTILDYLEMDIPDEIDGSTIIN